MAYNRNNKRDRGPRKNDMIRAPKVRVITDDGDNLGVMDTQEALAKAQELNLDLVEIGAKAKPPLWITQNICIDRRKNKEKIGKSLKI
jgi:translation initiation factor IF-3